jgi:hypothetical protein
MTLPGDTGPSVCQVTRGGIRLLSTPEVMKILRKNIPRVVLRVGDIIPGGKSVGFSTLLEEKEKRATFPDYLPRKNSNVITILMDPIPQEYGEWLETLTLRKFHGFTMVGARIVQKVQESSRICDSRSFKPHERVMC